MNLKSQKCVPCEGGMPALSADRVEELRAQIPAWEVRDQRLRRTLQFKDFKQAMAFVNRMADLAESEGHHPDFCVHYANIEVTLWTHAVGGLSENDFILAAKLDVVLLDSGAR
jgi:4a-hydroxytetrahydrobiopterin dehydratase